jgi:hypothetical protein
MKLRDPADSVHIDSTILCRLQNSGKDKAPSRASRRSGTPPTMETGIMTAVQLSSWRDEHMQNTMMVLGSIQGCTKDIERTRMTG